MDTPVATIDATGLHLPTYAEGLSYFQGAFRAIYGEDVVLEPSTQDGQFMALLARALKQCNDSVAQAYNAYSPATAQGTGLSSNVKINGVARKTPSRSSVDLRIVGQAGATLLSGVVSDDQGSTWTLPASITIPLSGELLVSATAADLGAIVAEPNTITTFVTVQQGFQTVANPSAAVPGAPVETDADLRRRQALSTSLPSRALLEGMLGAILALPGVSRTRAYENDTNITDASGIPGNCLAFVVEGGDAAAIAALIAQKKDPGVGTYGDVLTVLTDAYGIPHPIRFFRPQQIPVAWYVALRPLPGYTLDIRNQIQQALATWTNALGIGNRLALTRGYAPANLSGSGLGASFEILSLKAQRDRLAPPATGIDLEAAFDEIFVCDPQEVVVQAVPA